MSHEEWLLHQHFENVVYLIDYVENRLWSQDCEMAEKVHGPLVDLGKYISRELEKTQH